MCRPPNPPDRSPNTGNGQEAVDGPRHSLIDQLEDAILSRDLAARADIQRRVTDLFVVGSEPYDAEQMALFDDVMGRLVSEVESFVRAAFGERLAQIINAPPKVSRELALHDAIRQLDDQTLIASAKTKSQEHLLAISRRAVLSEEVTDVLVGRGNQQVVVSTAENAGARFSEFGDPTMITRAEADDRLALTIWSRPEVPRE